MEHVPCIRIASRSVPFHQKMVVDEWSWNTGTPPENKINI